MPENKKAEAGMKKILVLTALAIMFVCGQAQAQWIAGGYLGVNTVKDGVTEYSVMPEAGYLINDRLALGLGVRYESASSDDSFYSRVSANEIKDGHVFSVAPFARYKFASTGKVGLWLKGVAAIGTLSETKVNMESIEVSDGSGNIYYIDVLKEKDISGTGIEINIFPMVTYDFSKKITFFTQLNILSMNFSHWSGDYDTTVFGFGANSNNVVEIGNIVVGFLYKF